MPPMEFGIRTRGYEFNLVLVAAVFALAGIGAGNWSLDRAFGFDLHSTVWAIDALVVGVLGGVGTVLSGRIAAGQAPHPAS